MKAFRLAALGAALTIGVTTVAIAQPPAGAQPHRGAAARQHDGRGGDRQAGRGFARALLRDVNLTDAQKTQLQTINKKYAAERRSMMQSVRGNNTAQRPDSATRAQLRTQVQALTERQRNEVRGILTADQQKQFDANVAAFRDRVKAHGQRGERGARRADHR